MTVTVLEQMIPCLVMPLVVYAVAKREWEGGSVSTARMAGSTSVRMDVKVCYCLLVSSLFMGIYSVYCIESIAATYIHSVSVKMPNHCVYVTLL